MQPSFRYILSLLLFLPFLVLAAPSPVPAPSADPALPDLSGLLESLGGIGDLLNPKTFEYLAIILRNAAALLSDENTKTLVNVVKLLGGLLTKEMVDQLKGLINDIAPLVSAISKLISSLLGSLLG